MTRYTIIYYSNTAHNKVLICLRPRFHPLAIFTILPNSFFSFSGWVRQS